MCATEYSELSAKFKQCHNIYKYRCKYRYRFGVADTSSGKSIRIVIGIVTVDCFAMTVDIDIGVK